jgi:hypothetical protein
MGGTIIATTQSGSAYVLTPELGGIRWVRIPRRGRFHLASSGWSPTVPRVVPGERMVLGVLRTTPVDEVAFLPPPMVERMANESPVSVAT